MSTSDLDHLILPISLEVSDDADVSTGYFGTVYRVPLIRWSPVCCKGSVL